MSGAFPRRTARVAFLALVAAALSLVLFCALSLSPALVQAKSRPELTLRADSATVGVGDQLHITMQATTDGAAITNAELSAPRGFSSMGSSSGPTSSITIVNGQMTQKKGLNATWTLRADKIGSYDIGPVSIMVEGEHFTSAKVHVNVVAAGRAPQRQQMLDPFGSPLMPFDPFRGFFDNLGNQGRPAQQELSFDPKFAMDAPRAPVAFLHATIDKTEVVVGEQITLAVYLYQDYSEREPDSTDVHEASASDFLKHPLFEDDASNPPVGNALINGRPWMVKLVRKSALFPLKAGDLEIGPMSLSFVRMRGNGDPHRESESLHVRVTEPPLGGRPPGYTLGDVGNFTLSADVTPHDVERDGAIGVTVELAGTGNLPSSIVPPVRSGVEWLPPEVHEKIGATANDRFGGKRTFSFVVRLHKEGDVDLGSLTLPYWSPDSKAYGVARAPLGVVHVRPGATPAAADTVFDPLPKLPPPRLARAGAPPARAHLADSPTFWLGLGGAPLAYVVVAGVWAASQSVRKRRAKRKVSPETELRERMTLADRACQADDAKAAYAAIIRALESATIARAGVNVRDAQASQIAERLLGRGVDAAVAARFEALLRTCETARFSPEAGGATSVVDQWKEAKQAIASLVARAGSEADDDAEEPAGSSS